MRTDLLDRYVLLYARQEGGSFAFDYVDDACDEIACGREGRVEGATALGVSGFFDAGIGVRLASVLQSMPMQWGKHGTGVVPLAVFVGSKEGGPSPSISLTGIALEALVKAFGLNPDQVQGVVLPRRDWLQRAPFRLPLRVGAASPLLFDLLGGLQSKSWYVDDPYVSTHGLQFVQAWPHGLYDQWPDVLLVDEYSQLDLIAMSEIPKRPRLIITCGFQPWIDHPAFAVSSCLMIGALPSPDFVKAIVYALIHDQPLPEMLKSALRQVPAPAHLIADPVSAQQLRMYQAMTELENDVSDLEAMGYNASYNEGLVRGDEDASPFVLGWDAGGARNASPFELVRELRLDFGQESDALVPMSRVRARLFAVRSQTTNLRRRKKPEPDTPRTVDITMLRTNPRSGQALHIPGDTSLAAGHRYRVKVRIGRRSSVSLVVGEVPSIDTLLPPPTDEGHLLHIVCYPLDFEAVGLTIRRMILPAEGASKAVSFDVIAPYTAGLPARLRIAVYYDADLATEKADEADAYRNHLIQSFLLQTEVREQESTWKATTAVTLEFSRTAGYTRLDQYTARLASVAVNEAPDGTHQLMMKRGGKHRSFSLNPLLLQQAVTDVRATLFKATALDAAAKFPRFLDGAPPNEQEFDDVIRDLARAGAVMRQKVFADPATDTSTLLAQIAATTDEIVQVVRFDSDFYFPWQVVYDFEPPDEIFGAPPPPVCKEFRRTTAGGTRLTAKECLASCGHRDNNDAYCIYGFWGARLQVEQTLHRPNTNDEPIRTLEIQDEGILVVTDLHPTASKDLAGKLVNEIDANLVAELQAPPDLLGKLWSDTRPSIVLILGHYQTLPVKGEVNAPRVRVPGGWLIADKILRRVEKGGGVWTAPNPVVIMAACDSAGENLLTMNGFVTAFAKARAGAFLGTETTVFEPLARDFALAITRSLVRHQTLGASLLEFRRGLLQELNPLGFVFSAYGDAELVWSAPAGDA